MGFGRGEGDVKNTGFEGRRGEGAAQKKLKEKGGSGEILSEKSEMKFSKIVEIFSCFIHEI